jgi:CBS domain-containing protein
VRFPSFGPDTGLDAIDGSIAKRFDVLGSIFQTPRRDEATGPGTDSGFQVLTCQTAAEPHRGGHTAISRSQVAPLGSASNLGSGRAVKSQDENHRAWHNGGSMGIRILVGSAPFRWEGNMRVADVLRHKGSMVATVDPGATVAQVIGSLASHNVGALVVTDDGRSVHGIVSERDVVRALHTHGALLLSMVVSQIMTADVTTCVPGDDISLLARTMTDRRFRHMPVVVDGTLIGIVTIGDLVKGRIDELETEHDQLVGYISSTP